MNGQAVWRSGTGIKTITSTALLLLLYSGCAPLPNFPKPLEIHRENHETVFTFDTNHDGRGDYWQFQSDRGRTTALAYLDESTGAPAPRIILDEIDPSQCPHYLITLDGVPFEIVDELYRQGHFRFCASPSRVICCFPAMTDLALAELFHAEHCLAFQARYFDRAANRMTDGNAVYLSGKNSPWVDKLDYRCSAWWDGLAYLNPGFLFKHELRGMLKTIRRIDSGRAYVYSVASAGLGTRGGRAAIIEYLLTIEQLCQQIIHERHGRVHFTITADHGHNLVENRRISFRNTLDAAGYRQTKSLHAANDVVPVGYGLVTYAAFFTNDQTGVAECLLQNDAVELACYPIENAITVRDRDGQALIRRGETGFIYDSTAGDPLLLNPIIERLRKTGKVSIAGEIDQAALFDATLDHEYPDPLERLWLAFNGLVESPPDLVVILRDGYCYGSKFFLAMIGKVNSTHGSLNRMNSTTFVLTTLGTLPPAIRSRELLPALQALRDHPNTRISVDDAAAVR